jgi:hypothetical protein
MLEFIGEVSNTCSSLIRMLEEKKPHAEPWHRWKNNVKVNLTEIDCEAIG